MKYDCERYQHQRDTCFLARKGEVPLLGVPSALPLDSRFHGNDEWECGYDGGKVGMTGARANFVEFVRIVGNGVLCTSTRRCGGSIMAMAVSVDQGKRTAELVPARMLNEFAYCPRLCYLEWVQGEFAHSADTVDGRFQHRRVDRESGSLPGPGSEDGEVVHARSVLLSDEGLGAIARIDLVEAEGSRVTPVDYKRGTVPNVPEGAYEPERVQLCVQGLLLRAHGYECDEGVIYFVASKRRVAVRFDDGLVARTLELLDGARGMSELGEIPPPLEDSPKCPRCSLVGICLPDEVSFLRGSSYVIKPDDVRRMAPARDDALPMYVQAQGAVVGKSGDNVTVRIKGQVVSKTRLLDVSSVSIFGNAQVTAQATREFLDRGIPVCHFTLWGLAEGCYVGDGS